MAGKVGAAEHETEEMESKLDEAKEQAEAAVKECTRWKEKTAEIQRALRLYKGREARGQAKISGAVNFALTILAENPGQPLPLPHPQHRVEERVFELVNELVFDWHLPTSVVAGIVGAVSSAAVGVCYGDHVDDVDIDMGEHYEFDEREWSPVPDALVAGPSNPVVPPSLEELSEVGEGV